MRVQTYSGLLTKYWERLPCRSMAMTISHVIVGLNPIIFPLYFQFAQNLKIEYRKQNAKYANIFLLPNRKDGIKKRLQKSFIFATTFPFYKKQNIRSNFYGKNSNENSDCRA